MTLTKDTLADSIGLRNGFNIKTSKRLADTIPRNLEVCHGIGRGCSDQKVWQILPEGQKREKGKKPRKTFFWIGEGSSVLGVPVYYMAG